MRFAQKVTYKLVVVHLSMQSILSSLWDFVEYNCICFGAKPANVWMHTSTKQWINYGVHLKNHCILTLFNSTTKDALLQMIQNIYGYLHFHVNFFHCIHLVSESNGKTTAINQEIPYPVSGNIYDIHNLETTKLTT